MNISISDSKIESPISHQPVKRTSLEALLSELPLSWVHKFVRSFVVRFYLKWEHLQPLSLDHASYQ